MAAAAVLTRWTLAAVVLERAAETGVTLSLGWAPGALRPSPDPIVKVRSTIALMLASLIVCWLAIDMRFFFAVAPYSDGDHALVLVDVILSAAAITSTSSAVHKPLQTITDAVTSIVHNPNRPSTGRDPATAAATAAAAAIANAVASATAAGDATAAAAAPPEAK